jgi:hypothetical protein
MSFNKHKLSLKIQVENKVTIYIEEEGYTYQSVMSQLRDDLNNATENALKIISEIEGNEKGGEG